MPETAGIIARRMAGSARPRERPQRLFRQGEGIQARSADRCPSGPRRNGSPGGLPQEVWCCGARRSTGNGEVPGTVGDRTRPDLPREELDPREAEQVSGGLRERPKAVDELLGQIFHLGEGAQSRGPAVQVYAFDLIQNVARRQIRVERELHDNGPLFMTLLRLSARGGDGFLQEGQIHLEADGRYVPRLLGAERVARTPDLQVSHGDGESTPELGKVQKGFEPLLGLDRRP